MNPRVQLPDPCERTFDGVGVVFDPERNVAVLEKKGQPIGTAFRGFRQGALYIDAAVAAKWFIFGLNLQGLHPAELSSRDFLAAKGSSNNLLGYGAWSATRCAVTDRAAISAFFEAAFRGKLKDYEIAFHRLTAATGATPDATAEVFNRTLVGWNWLVECAYPDAERALRAAAGKSLVVEFPETGEQTGPQISP